MMLSHRKPNWGRRGKKEIFPSFSPITGFQLHIPTTAFVESVELVLLAGYGKGAQAKGPSGRARCLVLFLSSEGRTGGVGYACAAGTNGTAWASHWGRQPVSCPWLTKPVIFSL